MPRTVAHGHQYRHDTSGLGEDHHAFHIAPKVLAGSLLEILQDLSVGRRWLCRHRIYVQYDLASVNKVKPIDRAETKEEAFQSRCLFVVVT